MPSFDEIQDRIRGALAVVLSLKPEAIAPRSRIIDDLHAESLDLLDLRFRLEEMFQLKFTQVDIARAVGNDLSAEEFRRRFTLEALTRYVQSRLEAPRG